MVPCLLWSRVSSPYADLMSRNDKTCKWRQISNISACRRCSNYIFILDLTPGTKGLGKDNCKTRREVFKFLDLVLLILEVWRYILMFRRRHSARTKRTQILWRTCVVRPNPLAGYLCMSISFLSARNFSFNCHFVLGLTTRNVVPTIADDQPIVTGICRIFMLEIACLIRNATPCWINIPKHTEI